MIQDNSKLHDFEIFEGCFGNTQIMPTDIDFIVERNGKFLVIEFKPESKTVSVGQMILLRHLAERDGFTVVVMWHKACEMHQRKEMVTMQQIGGLDNDNKKDICNDDARDFVMEWYKIVNSMP